MLRLSWSSNQAQAQQWKCAQVAVFTVLQLPHPSPAQPYIKGLLDPCTNSMTMPNIPAEKLYDKKVFSENPAVLAPSARTMKLELEAHCQ